MSSATTFSLPDLIALRHCVPDIKRAYTARAQAIEAGSYHSRLKGRGMEFSAVRAYQAGDDIRHMDWRVTARTQKPHIKCYEAERERPVFFVVDQSARTHFGTRIQLKSVLAARLSALLAWLMASQGERIGGVVWSENDCLLLKARAHRQGVLPFLNALVSVHGAAQDQSQTIDLGDALLRLRKAAKQRGLVFIISDFLTIDARLIQQLSRLGMHHECILIRLIDPIESASLPKGRYPITDGHASCVLDLGSKHSQQCYRDYFEMLTEQYQSLAARLNIAALTLSTQEALVPAVRKILLKEA